MKINRIWGYRVRGTASSRVVRQFDYRGFRIDILDNNSKDFKFEYVLAPLSPTAKAITAKACKRWKEERINDPTSHRFLKVALDSARIRANELLSPFWFKDWKY